MRRLPGPVLVGLFLGALSLPALAQGQGEAPKTPRPKDPKEQQEEFPRWTIQGTFYTDFSAVEAEKHARDPFPEEGVTGEFAMGATYHADKSLTVVVRACVGCHSFELENAYFDWEMTPTWSLRAGRIPVPFGGLSRRTDASHVESATKPLPYMMGGMPYEANYNLGIVPAPFIDNGAAVTGTFWVTKNSKVTVETALVRGLKGTSPDLDFELSRDFEDFNGEPAVAGRVLLATDTITTGASFTCGHYDFDSDLEYFMGSVEMTVRLGTWNLRLEGVMRDTDYFTPDAFSMNRRRETSHRIAYVVQADGPIAEAWRGFLLHDYLKVEDIFLGLGGPASMPNANTTDDENTTFRLAGGVVYSVRAGLQVKGSVEYWDPSDFEKAVVFHLGLVASY